MSKAVLGIVGAVLAAGAGYYHFLYPPRLMEKATEDALEAFAAAVATHERSRVSAQLEEHLTDNAKLHFEVTFFSLTQRGSQPVAEDFSKKDFITFIDNVLFPLDTYNYTPRLVSFKANDDYTAADVTFRSSEWADGKSYYGGVAVGMRFSSDTECEARVVFARNVPGIEKASCKISMRTVPKPEEAYKIQGNPEAMQQFLTR